jgi:hypothetical protein
MKRDFEQTLSAVQSVFGLLHLFLTIALVWGFGYLIHPSTDWITQQYPEASTIVLVCAAIAGVVFLAVKSRRHKRGEILPPIRGSAGSLPQSEGLDKLPGPFRYVVRD